MKIQITKKRIRERESLPGSDSDAESRLSQGGMTSEDVKTSLSEMRRLMFNLTNLLFLLFYFIFFF